MHEQTPEGREHDLQVQAALGADIHYIQQIADLRALLKRAEPALWLLATGGHAEAVQIHRDVRDALAK